MTAMKLRSNFSSSVMADKSRLYLLRYQPEAGTKIFYFLLVNPLKEKAFLKAMSGTEAFNINEYGKIVASGYGEPSEEVKQQMRDLYDARV